MKNKDRFETNWLRQAIAARVRRSGLSRYKWLQSIGCENSDATALSFILSGARGYTFWKGVRVASLAGIDLAQLQKIIRRKFPPPKRKDDM